MPQALQLSAASSPTERAPVPGPLGILMLETGFTRPPGDIGHPASFAFPVRYATVPGASARRVVHARAEGLLEPFVAAGKHLVEQGAVGLMTSCGFLALHQEALAAALPVPVATSSLLQLPLVDRLLPRGRRAGVLTASAADLTPAHLTAVGAAPDTPTAGLDPEGHFASVLLGSGEPLDPARAAADLLDAADRLRAAHPAIGALVLECTNMGSYTRALARHTGLPIYDVIGFAHWFHRGLCP